MESLGVVTQNLSAALQSSQLKEACSVWGYHSQLQKLEVTVETIKAVLVDGERKQAQEGLSSQALQFLEELKDAVYDADDLIDEIVTIAEAKQRRSREEDSVKTKVRRLFSFDNPLLVARITCQQIKGIGRKLDAIVDTVNQFGFKHDYRPIRRMRKESSPYVYAPNIIGREGDVEKIVPMLLNPDNQHEVSSLSIVGMGGLGKTSLARLVFNDTRIVREFQLRIWVCVSDQGEKCLDIKKTLLKILQSATSQKHEYTDIHQVLKKLREKLVRKKYLLVLDDMWNEDPCQWLKLVEFLRGGLMGSWIVVTTRSRETAAVVGNWPIYDLPGLSNENSWHLFESIAFGNGYEGADHSDLLQIGRDIVKRCANVPLAIKVMGSLLYGQDKEKWLSIRDDRLGSIGVGENLGIQHVLKLSYDHLEPSLKTCLSYCAIFPKDHVIYKHMLISLWIAQGYVEPVDGQSIDDVGEEYFSILLRRGFFQDVETNEFSEVSFKLHDLMHDLAQGVAGNEILVTDSIASKLHKRVRHLSLLRTTDDINYTLTRTTIRTCLRLGHTLAEQIPISLTNILANWKCLRALDLRCFGLEVLPNTLGKLLHLRYLDLSSSWRLQMLPNSITDLHNLQTLNLHGCKRLKKLPDAMRKLVQLRVLDLSGCWELTDMPCGMGQLSHLRKLSMFAVAVDANSKHGVIGKLQELQSLHNLKGPLFIRILINSLNDDVHATGNALGGGYIRNKQHLDHINIQFVSKTVNERLAKFEEELMENLQPHPNLRKLELLQYYGRRMPSWGREAKLATSFSGLTHILVNSCYLQHMPSFHKLPYLKSLRVEGSKELEYIENIPSQGSSIGAGVLVSEQFYPSLEEVYLKNLPKLKAWLSENQMMMDINKKKMQQYILLPPFPQLISLSIWECPHLTSMPSCPSLERLQLRETCNKDLQLMAHMKSGNSNLRKIITEEVGSLTLMLPREAFKYVEEMVIENDKEIERFTEVQEVFQSCSSLRSLRICDCCKLKSVCGGLKHLTALKDLSLIGLSRLNLSNAKGEREGEEDDGIPWHCFGHSLISLTLNSLPQLVNLPDGIGNLIALQSLSILNCPALESIPGSIQNLISLKRLEVYPCSTGLKERCQNPTGKDWPNIQHICDIIIH